MTTHQIPLTGDRGRNIKELLARDIAPVGLLVVQCDGPRKIARHSGRLCAKYEGHSTIRKFLEGVMAIVQKDFALGMAQTTIVQ